MGLDVYVVPGSESRSTVEGVTGDPRPLDVSENNEVAETGSFYVSYSEYGLFLGWLREIAGEITSAGAEGRRPFGRLIDTGCAGTIDGLACVTLANEFRDYQATSDLVECQPFSMTSTSALRWLYWQFQQAFEIAVPDGRVVLM